MSDPMSESIFKEVDEELRQDQLLALWKRFGPYLIGGFIAIIAVASAYVWYQNHVTAEQTEQSRAFNAALAMLDAGDRRGAADAFAAISADADSGYRDLAAFRQAAALIQDGDLDAGVAVYTDLIARTDDDIHQSLAHYLAGVALYDAGRVETALTHLQPLAVPEGTWYLPALEYLALIDLDRGDLLSAHDKFSTITTSGTAATSLANRARSMVELLETQNPTLFALVPIDAELTGEADTADAENTNDNAADEAADENAADGDDAPGDDSEGNE